MRWNACVLDVTFRLFDAFGLGGFVRTSAHC